jgi:hypothetical protein
MREFFQFCCGDALTPFKMIKRVRRKILMHLKSSSQGPTTSWRDGCPANKGDKDVHHLPWEEDSPHTKILFRVIYYVCSL